MHQVCCKIASPKLKLYFPTHLRAVELLSRRGPLKNSARSDHIKEEHSQNILLSQNSSQKKGRMSYSTLPCTRSLGIFLSIKTHKITNRRCLFISSTCILQNAMDYLFPASVSKSNTASTTRLELTSYTLVRMTHSLGQTLLCYSTKRAWCVGEICLIVQLSSWNEHVSQNSRRSNVLC